MQGFISPIGMTETNDKRLQMLKFSKVKNRHMINMSQKKLEKKQ